MGVLELLELTCPTACTCLFKLRPGVLSKTLSHMWGKLNLPIFLYNVGLLTLNNMDSLIFLAKHPELLCKLKAHLRKELTQCKYPKWALDKLERRLKKSSREVSDGVNNQGTAGAQPATNEVKTKGHIVIPYTQGLCESMKKICGRYGIQTHFKNSNTIRNLLVSPRTKTLCSTKVGPYIGSNVVTSPVMMNK